MSSVEKSLHQTSNIRSIVRENVATFIALIVLIIAVSFLSDKFLSSSNLINLLRQVSILGIITLGQTFVLIGGNYDLSVGSLLSLSSVLVIGLQPELGIFGAVAVTLIIGLGIGILNGVLVGYAKANSFIVTLGMLSVLQAAALIYTGGMTLKANIPGFHSIGGISFGVMPILVIYFLVAIILARYLLDRSTFGRKVFLVGSNQEAAHIAGIAVGRVISWTFIISALSAALGGILMSSRVMNASPTAGMGMELDAISAAVLGGTSIYGGEGRALNAVIGVMILGVLTNAMTLLGIPYQYQLVVKGVILIAVVGFESYRRVSKQ